MKILMFCHHPDVLHYAYRAFTELGHEIHIASEELTIKIGFQYSSVKQNKLEIVDQLFDPGVLFSDMQNVIFSNSMDGYDLYWSMLPQITSLSNHGLKTWFDGQMQVYLRDTRYSSLPGIKTANHPDAWILNKFQFLPNWVSFQPDLIESKFITQLITECDRVSTTQELKTLKQMGLPIKIYGGSKCPDGFIRDINILPYTAMLVHDKQFGINCYAVCKALDIGIPVYMSRQTRTMIGFGDLPDDVFLFSDEYCIQDAYMKAKTIDNQRIRDTYRSIYTLDRTVNTMKQILDEHFIPEPSAR